MKRFLSLFLIVFAMCTLLSGCGPVYNTTYSYVAPKTSSGKMCTLQCNQMRMTCQQSCAIQNNAQTSQCQQQSQENAKMAYKAYKQQRKSQGKPIKKTFSDFVDPYACDEHASCQCSSNYRDCFAGCGGQVIAHQQCVAFCNQAKPQQSQLVPQKK